MPTSEYELVIKKGEASIVEYVELIELVELVVTVENVLPERSIFAKVEIFDSVDTFAMTSFKYAPLIEEIPNKSASVVELRVDSVEISA
jgi:hypothetical protein